MPPVSIAIVEDHPVTLAGLKSLFADRGDFVVSGEATCGRDALVLFDRIRPDVLLLDMLLPDLDGAEVARLILAEHSGARIIVLSSSQESENIHRAIEAGARGYLLKTATPVELFDAIFKVLGGGRALPKDVARKLAERPLQAALSEREMEVLRLLVAGGSNKDIASKLDIGEATVRTHVSHILMKLNVDDRTSAVSVALRHGIVRG